MTVGVAAICERETDPKVVLAADRLLTTQQLSAIEHEYPETKIKQVGEHIPTLRALIIYSGNVSWGEQLHQQIGERSQEFLANDQDVNMNLLAEIAAEQYRVFIQNRIQRQLLDHYGIGLEDLSSQHRFKDQFMDDVLTEIDNAEQTIKNNLTALVGGVDGSGAYVFQIANSDVTPHNEMGYATIGSGHQPAASEFLESEYSAAASFDEALATVTAATVRARQASGVGGDIDIGVVDPETEPQMADEATVNALINRYEDIAERQREVKSNVLNSEEVNWVSRGPP